MVELDYDKVLEELSNQAKNPDSNQFPEILERYLESIAKTGDTIFPWSKVKPFIRKKMEAVMENFHQRYPLNDAQLRVPNCDPFDYNGIKMNILQSLDWFYAAPFTIQRLCELLIEPYRHYSRTDKFLRGIEKNVIVVSTIQPQPNKYSTPETVEKQPTFRDLYPEFSVSRSRSSSISSAINRCSTSPPPNNSPSSSSSSCSSASASPHSSQQQISLQQQTNNTNLVTNGFDSDNHHMGHHPVHHHHHHHHSHNTTAHHLHQNGPFDGSSGPYSLSNLANSSPTPTFYSSSDSTGPQNNSGGHYTASITSNTLNNNTANDNDSPSNTASSQLSTPPLQQLDSFTSVFVASSYLTNHHHQTMSNHPSSNIRGHSWSGHHHRPSPVQESSDDNENIIVDDDYDQQQITADRVSGDDTSINLYQNRSVANIIASNPHFQSQQQDAILNQPPNTSSNDDEEGEQSIVSSERSAEEVGEEQTGDKTDTKTQNDNADLNLISDEKSDNSQSQILKQEFDHVKNSSDIEKQDICLSKKRVQSATDDGSSQKSDNEESGIDANNQIKPESNKILPEITDRNHDLKSIENSTSTEESQSPLEPNKKLKLINEEQKKDQGAKSDIKDKNKLETNELINYTTDQSSNSSSHVDHEDLLMDMSGVASSITQEEDQMDHDEKMNAEEESTQPMNIELPPVITSSNLAEYCNCSVSGHNVGYCSCSAMEDQIMSEPMEQE